MGHVFCEIFYGVHSFLVLFCISSAPRACHTYVPVSRTWDDHTINEKPEQKLRKSHVMARTASHRRPVGPRRRLATVTAMATSTTRQTTPNAGRGKAAPAARKTPKKTATKKTPKKTAVSRKSAGRKERVGAR